MKTKKLENLNLKEFELYQELLAEETVDMYALFELFGYNLDDMDIPTMQSTHREISGYKLENKGIKSVYKINGRRFKVTMNLTKIKAAQFIDLQGYLKNMKLQNVLSVFLIPQKRTWYGGWKTMNYNDGYDIFEVQEFLYENFLISDASELSAFFFNQSSDLLKVMKDYLAKKEMKMKYKQLLVKQKVK